MAGSAPGGQSSDAQDAFTKACAHAFENKYLDPKVAKDTNFLGQNITADDRNPMWFDIGDPTLEKRPGRRSGGPGVFESGIGDALVPFLIQPVLVWAPECLWPSLMSGVPCPKCNGVNVVKYMKWSFPPRRVLTFGGYYFMIGESTNINAPYSSSVIVAFFFKSPLVHVRSDPYPWS